MSATTPTGFNAWVNWGLNGIGEGTVSLLDKGSTVIAPAVLGYVGGWGTGVGVQVGLFQGMTSGVYHRFVHIPFQKYIKNNTDKTSKDPNRISRNAADFYECVGVVAGIAVPILVTYYCRNTVTNMTDHLAPEGWTKWLLSSTKTRDYSALMGVAVNLFPTIAQHWISKWRHVDDENKKKLG